MAERARSSVAAVAADFAGCRARRRTSRRVLRPGRGAILRADSATREARRPAQHVDSTDEPMPERNPTSLLTSTLARALEFLDELPDRHVAPAVDLDALRAAMGGPLSDEGVPADEVVARLDEAARPGLVATAGPRFFGFV